MVARITSPGRQEALLERAHQHHRPFDKAGHLIQQRLVLDTSKPCAKARFCASSRMIVLAALGVEHDLRRFELRT
jgi:hypothetical protein